MATNIDQSNNLVIGNGVTFKGTLNVPKKATIYGTVDGELTAEEIFIGQSGKITGKVTARAIEVEGELHQIIHCLEPGAEIEAFHQIQIERGGEFRGEMQQVGAPPVYPAGSAPSAPKPNVVAPGIPTPPTAPAGGNTSN